MLVAEVLNELGGLATRAFLIDTTSRTDVDRALRHGEIVAWLAVGTRCPRWLAPRPSPTG